MLFIYMTILCCYSKKMRKNKTPQKTKKIILKMDLKRKKTKYLFK